MTIHAIHTTHATHAADVDPPTLSPAVAPVVSYRPLTLPPFPGRGAALQVRVTAPATGAGLPVIVFSHGFGWSMDGYAPLVDAWASRGFVVVQPTHLDSRTLQLTPDDPRFADIWRIRVQDLVHVIDHLADIETSVPGLGGRLAHDRIAVAGHSWGGQTASMLLAARVLDGHGTPGPDLTDSRVGAGILLATPGSGGSDLSPFAAEHFPFMHPSFAGMRTPTLVVAGDRDESALTVRGTDWFTDPYHRSPSPKMLLTLFGGEHSLGGIPGYSVSETTDESPERVAFIQRVTSAFLHGVLQAGTPLDEMLRVLEGDSPHLGRVEAK